MTLSHSAIIRYGRIKVKYPMDIPSGSPVCGSDVFLSKGNWPIALSSKV